MHLCSRNFRAYKYFYIGRKFICTGLRQFPRVVLSRPIRSKFLKIFQNLLFFKKIYFRMSAWKCLLKRFVCIYFLSYLIWKAELLPVPSKKNYACFFIDFFLRDSVTDADDTSQHSPLGAMKFLLAGSVTSLITWRVANITFACDYLMLETLRDDGLSYDRSPPSSASCNWLVESLSTCQLVVVNY